MSSVVKRNAPLTNADFETGDLTGWVHGGSWVNIQTAADASWVKPHTGVYMLNLAAPAWIEQTINVTPGTQITIAGWLNSYDSSRFVSISVKFNNESAYRELGQATGSGQSWVQFSKVALAPSGATMATVRYSCKGANIRLDDLYISEVNAPIEDTAFVYLDGRPLPIRLGTEGDLPSALAPFTLTWGTKAPWDDLEPCILALSLIDPNGTFSKSQGNIIGRTLQLYNCQQDPMPIFDGTITSAKLTNLNDAGKAKIDILASDKAWNIKTDTAAGPRAADRMYKGYQWAGSAFFDWVGERFRSDGIASYSTPSNGVYGSDPLATERISVYDVMKNKRSDHSTTPPTIRFGQVSYLSSFNSQQANAVWLTYLSLTWNRKITLTGHQITMPDDFFNDAFDGDMMKSTIIEQARNIQIDRDATVAPADEFYSQAEIKYYSRSVTNPGATIAEQDKGNTVMTFSQDQSRLLRVDSGSREGENVLTIDMDEYINADGTTPNDNMRVSGFNADEIITTVHANNSRLRLPELTFCSKRIKNIWRYIPQPGRLLILGSKFERFFPDTHGAWITISGQIIFDPRNPRGAWTHRVKTVPSPMPDSYRSPTVEKLKALTDPQGQLSNCKYPVGALRYITDTANPQ